MEKLNLKAILQEYEQTLCNRIFHYELSGTLKLDLVFYTENFCHLMGFHHVFLKDKRYLGASGYKMVNDEKLTVESLKLHNEKGFNFIKNKMENFSNIYKLLTKGKITGFDTNKVIGDTIISASLVIYHKNKEVLLHLFLRKERNDSNQYAPVSFIVKSLKDKNYNQFIARQRHIAITKFEIVNTEC